MKFKFSYIIQVSLVLSLAVFLIERMMSGNGFDQPISTLLKVFGIHFMYAFTLFVINAFFFSFLERKLSWKEQGLQRLLIGALGSVALTMAGLVLLRFVTLVLIFQNPVSYFLNDPAAGRHYLFGLVVTLIISLIFHVFYFYKALTAKKVEEQQIVAKTETAKYESLKSQIDPHFLFNSLNVLTSLIGENPERAEHFTTKLSRVYRYVLEQKNKDLINLSEELEFARSYMELLKMRFEDAVTFDIMDTPSQSDAKIIPLSLQLLLENTVKHNVVDEGKPLNVKIYEERGYLVISNNFNPKSVFEKGTKVGLKNITDRYALITLKKVQVEKDKEQFKVKLPLLTQKTKTMERTNKDEIRANKYFRAVERVNEIKEFYGNVISFCIVIPFLIFIYYRFTPGVFEWYWFAIFGWGIGLVFHGLKAFNYGPFLGRDWEDRKIKEFMEDEDKHYWE